MKKSLVMKSHSEITCWNQIFRNQTQKSYIEITYFAITQWNCKLKSQQKSNIWSVHYHVVENIYHQIQVEMNVHTSLVSDAVTVVEYTYSGSLSIWFNTKHHFLTSLLYAPQKGKTIETAMVAHKWLRP